MKRGAMSNSHAHQRAASEAIVAESQMTEQQQNDRAHLYCREAVMEEVAPEMEALRARVAEMEGQAQRTAEQLERTFAMHNQETIGLQAHNARLRAALERVLPMVRACKHEHFSDLKGSEDTRTAALSNAEAALSSAPAPEKFASLPEVAGRVLDCTLGFFEQRCLVHIRDEQARPNCDSTLVALLCDAVRLGREYCDGKKALIGSGRILPDEAAEPQPDPVRKALEDMVDVFYGLPVAARWQGQATSVIDAARKALKGAKP